MIETLINASGWFVNRTLIPYPIESTLVLFIAVCAIGALVARRLWNLRGFGR